jgi:hypothetical protein
VAAAQRGGLLSVEKVVAIAEAATADPSAARRLLRHARRRSVGEVRDECAKVIAAADPDPDATHSRVRAGRCATRRCCADGSSEIRYRSTLEEVTEVWAVVAGYATAAFDAARLQGRHQPGEAYAADGMLAMARAAAGASGSGPVVGRSGRVRSAVPKTIIFRCDWTAALRGHVQGGETCDIAGVGPVPVAVIRELVEHGDPFLAAVLTKGKDVMSVAHLGRSPTAYQMTALHWQQPGCTRLGCNRVLGLQRDHRVDWARTHHTPTAGIDWLCEHDHNLKTRHGWALTTGTGKRPMVPPNHPNHPDHPNRLKRLAGTTGRLRSPPEAAASAGR